MQPPDSWRLRPSAGNTAQMIENTAQRIDKELQLRKRNPFADPEIFVGFAASRELAKQEAGGDFHKKGKPSQLNLDRALPGQVATALNMLSFVCDVNELISLRLLAAGGPASSFTFHELKSIDIREALGDLRFEVLPDKYAAMVGYLRSARRFGFLGFDGEIEPMSSHQLPIISLTVGWTRSKLLAAAFSEERHLALIAESNVERLKACLQDKPTMEPGEDAVLLKVRAEIQSMVAGFRAGDTTGVQAAMAAM